MTTPTHDNTSTSAPAEAMSASADASRVSRRGWGKHLLLSASALACAPRRDEERGRPGRTRHRRLDARRQRGREYRRHELHWHHQRRPADRQDWRRRTDARARDG